ncbi:MAG: hypothetical protein IJE43_26165 [Alphaproteobacteria bacterium]|nr:hypothetical protein [Alphaproteobacteria bacterium]
MDMATKRFILDNLIDAIQDVHTRVKEDREMTYDEYKIHFDYLNKLLEIVIRKYVPTEYEIILNRIQLIDLKKDSYEMKLLYICDILIQLAKTVVENY